MYITKVKVLMWGLNFVKKIALYSHQKFEMIPKKLVKIYLLWVAPSDIGIMLYWQSFLPDFSWNFTKN